jgi:hypothetical protein
MKKALPAIVIAALVVAAVVFFLKKSEAPAFKPGLAAELAPPDTLVFLEFPDIARSKARWKETGLRKIGDEPEWKEFTAKWDDFAAQNAEWREVSRVFDEIERADPAGLFMAFTSVEPPAPKMVGGFPYRGKKSDVQAVVSNFRKRILDAFPAAKVEDLTSYEGTEIETLKDKDMTLCLAYRDNWFFFSTDNELLLKTLSRYVKKPDAPASLSGDALWKETIKHGTPEPDMMVFVRWDPIAKMFSNLAALGLTGREFPENPNKVESMLYSAKMDGLLMRDHIYVRAGKVPKIEPFANRSAAFSSPATYAFGGVQVGAYGDVMQETFATLGQADTGLSKSLATKGLKIEDIFSTFGPELAMQSDWDSGGLSIPTFFAAAEIRNREKAGLFAELIAAEMMDERLTKSEEGGTTFWTLGGQAPAFQVTLALNDRHMLFGLNPETVRAALKNAKPGPVNLSGRADYQAALKTVSAPDMGLLYVDMKTLFERLYEKLKPMAAYALMGQPEAAKYFDATKLPKAETISRHLAPMTVSWGYAEGGMQTDCTGTVSLIQSYVPMVGGVFLVGTRMGAPAAPAPVTKQKGTAVPGK